MSYTNCKHLVPIFFLVGVAMCTSRKYPYSPHRRDWNFLVGGGSVRPKNLKKCVELYWNFQRGGGGGGGLRKNLFRGGSMDIFWNYTMALNPKCKKFLMFCDMQSKECFGILAGKNVQAPSKSVANSVLFFGPMPYFCWFQVHQACAEVY